METQFIQFMEKLKDPKTASFIENAKRGFKVIMESYADVRDEIHEPAIDRFQNIAASANSTMAFIKRSTEQNRHHYSIDEEPELDFNDTSTFNQAFYDSPTTKSYDAIEDSLGLTSGDLYDRRNPAPTDQNNAFDLSNFDPDSFR